MRILVTGGAGYIGSHTCKRLRELGHEVLIYDNFITGNPQVSKYGKVIVGNIKDEPKLRSLLSIHKPDGIIHFASFSSVSESVINPVKYYDNNITGFISILSAMKATQTKNIVVSSSSAVYGNSDSEFISEDHPTLPISPYGFTSLIIERMLSEFNFAYGINFVALRYSNAAGASKDKSLGENHDPEFRILPLLIKSVINNSQVNIFGNDYPTPDGTCIRDYIHVSDLADAHILSLEYLIQNNPSQILNIGPGTGISILELISLIEELTNRKVNYIIQSRRSGDPARLIVNPAKSKQILNWQPTCTLSDMITDTFNFLNSK